jgi:hypothetical protein
MKQTFIGDQMQLEAEEPPSGGLAALGYGMSLGKLNTSEQN